MVLVTDLDAARPSLWTGRHLRTTIGIGALAFLFAFEALAVATVMPRVAEELDGLTWYGAAFAAPLATSVVAYALAGRWIDRRGTRPAIAVGVVVFCLGVVLAGLAPSMPVLMLGRLVQGFGAGACGVAIYVVVAQAYDEVLRPGAFAVLSAAWVGPALVGPVLAATVADTVGWRWIFLAVPVIALPSWWLIRDAPGEPTGGGSIGGGPTGAPHTVGWAVLAALGVAGHLTLTSAYARAAASKLAAIEYTALIWASLLGFHLFGEVPLYTTYVGALLIIAGAVAVSRR